MTRRPGKSIAAPTVLLIASVLVAASLSGCYRKVVRDEGGFARTAGPVSESDRDSSRVPVVDDLLDEVD